MTDRERLIELISKPMILADSSDREMIATAYAERILADGWIRPPCKVGDTVYYAGVDTPIKFTVIGFSKGRMYDCSVADYEEFVEDNELNVDEWYVHLDSFCGLKQMSPLSSFGKRLFVGDDAEKEAEKALAKRNCDIAQNIESCEDCGFCERNGASDV